MKSNENATIKDRIEYIRSLNERSRGHSIEEIALAQSLLYDTVGRNHPLMTVLDEVLKSNEPRRIIGAIRSVVALYEALFTARPVFALEPALKLTRQTPQSLAITR